MAAGPFTFFDAFMLEVVEQLLRQQRDQQHGKPVGFLVLEAIAAGHVAFGRRK